MGFDWIYSGVLQRASEAALNPNLCRVPIRCAIMP